VSEYDTIPEIIVAPCCTVNVDVVIVLRSIGVLKVAVINFIAVALADPAAALVLKIAAMLLIAATPSDPVVMFVFSKGTFVPPLTGDVRITVGVIQRVTIPGSSALQPPQKTTKSKAAVNPADSVTPENPRNIREKGAHRLKVVVGFVVGVFMVSSINSERMNTAFLCVRSYIGS
jgi:hypothetical protein